MKVLVVEDDAVSSLVMQKLVSRFGHQPTAAGNGREALEALKRDPEVQIVLSDWVMPFLDGPDLCRRIRSFRQFRYTYFVMVTSREGKESYLEALEAGADDFISKPVDPDELAARLSVAARIVGLQDEMQQLRGLLSICQYCKRIRETAKDEAEEKWVPVERYVSKRADTSFSHGICPECYAKHFPE